MSRKAQFTPILAFAGLALAMVTVTSQAHAAALTFGSRTLVSTNNANFDISVFDGNAKYNDRGVGGSQPGAPTFQTILGDGTVLDYNFVGNANNGAGPLTTYASGAAGRIPTPTSAAVKTGRTSGRRMILVQMSLSTAVPRTISRLESLGREIPSPDQLRSTERSTFPAWNRERSTFRMAAT